MKRLLPSLAISAALAASLVTSAHAIEFNQLQADKSSVTFAYKQMGVSMDGKFRKFTSQISFDPAQPTKAKAVIEIDLASIDTGSGEGDAEVVGKPWFNTAAFPAARFQSSGVKALGGNRYELAGALTIKGKTQQVVIPTTFTAQGTTGVFDGSFTLRRGDFSIGEGAWASFDMVANDIQVKFRITATGK